MQRWISEERLFKCSETRTICWIPTCKINTNFLPMELHGFSLEANGPHLVSIKGGHECTHILLVLRVGADVHSLMYANTNSPSIGQMPICFQSESMRIDRLQTRALVAALLHSLTCSRGVSPLFTLQMLAASLLARC